METGLHDTEKSGHLDKFNQKSLQWYSLHISLSVHHFTVCLLFL